MEEQVEAMLAGFINHFEQDEALLFIRTFEKLAGVMSGAAGAAAQEKQE
jgi:hypothetical protein